MDLAQRVLAAPALRRFGLQSAGVLERVQLSLFAVASAATVLAIVLLLTDDAAHRGLPVPSILAAVGIWLVWAYGYRRRSYPWPLALLEAAFIVTGGAVQGVNNWLTVIQLTGAIFFRISLAQPRDACWLVASWTVTVTGGFILATQLGLPVVKEYTLSDGWYVLISVTLLSLPVLLVVELVARYEASVGRERALLSAGTALVASGSHDEVGAVAVRAAQSLVAGCDAQVRWLSGELLDSSGSEVIVLTPDPGDPRRAALGLRRNDTHAAVVAVTAQDHQRLLLLETPMALSPPVIAALSALASTLTIGLESVATTHELRRQTEEDALTGLANRAALMRRVADASARAEVTGTATAAVLFMDLDGFKDINDQLGHAAGDAVLVTVAERLRQCVRPGDVVARIGGDEFVILAQDIAEGSEVRALANRVVATLDVPLGLVDTEVAVGGSVGVAIVRPGWKADAVIEAADAAMYAAKAAGKATYVMAGDHPTSGVQIRAHHATGRTAARR